MIFVQVKKESVYNNIYNSALNEFWANGYDKATMRNIAKNANITLGNIYRYFPNKASLFEEIVGSTYQSFLTFIDDHKDANLKKELKEKDTYVVSLLNNYLSLDKKKVSILLNGSKGTKFADFERKNIEFFAAFSEKASEVIEKEEGIVIVDPEIHHFIAETLFSSIKRMTLLFNDEKKIKAYIEKLFVGYHTDLIRRLGYRK